MRTLIPVLFVCVAACGGDSPYASLFDPPTVGATGSLYGIWAGDLGGIEARIVLESTEVTLAGRCGSKIVGVDAAASVSETEFNVLESAHDGSSSCYVTLMPHNSTPCSTDPFTPKDDCFEHDGLELTLYDTDVDFLSLTKISDALP
jgi:hypothetical protein